MRLHVVLVRTESAGNIGATARAMANMGAERLILIDPQCRVSEQAKKMAAGAQRWLSERVVYKNWDEFYEHEGEGLRLAFTRRAGRKRKVHAVEEKLGEISKLKGARRPKNLYLIFGPEADGLNVEDMALVNYAVHLPVHGEFGSLNLAQAVLLALYVTREIFPPAKAAERVKAESEIEEPAAPIYFPDELIREWLTTMGFDIHARKSSAYLTLKQLFLVNLPTKHEIQVLESILQQNLRKLRYGKRYGRRGRQTLNGDGL